MELHYTAHCEEQIVERKLEKVWIEETVKYPDKTETVGDKYYVTRKINGGTLRVVYVKGCVDILWFSHRIANFLSLHRRRML